MLIRKISSQALYLLTIVVASRLIEACLLCYNTRGTSAGNRAQFIQFQSHGNSEWTQQGHRLQSACNGWIRPRQDALPIVADEGFANLMIDKRDLQQAPHGFFNLSEDGDAALERTTTQNDDRQEEDLSSDVEPKTQPDLMSVAMIATLGFYKNFISPLLPPACRFVPTCSRYGVLAIQEFGPAKGVILIAWRLLRCSPIGGKGYDPPQWPPVPFNYSSY
jgi:hypothetical protein